MADFAGLALAVGQVISSLLEVASDAKDAPRDIRDLRNEVLAGLFTLKGSLSYLPAQSMAKLEALGWTRVAHEEMISMMNKAVRSPSSTTGRAMQYATWHWDKKKVHEHLERVERIKSWVVIATTTDIASSVDRLSQDLKSLEVSISKDKDLRADEIRHSSHQRLLQYLAPLSPKGAHRQAISRHEPGTSAWFIQGPVQEFLSLANDGKSVMWLKGKSGSGKTTLLAQSVEQLQLHHQKTEILYWYCAFDNPESQRPERLLGSILARLASKTSSIFNSLVPLMEAAEAKGEQPLFPRDVLEKIFLQNHAAVPSMVIVIDAINESTMQTDMELLVQRMGEKCSNLHIIVSSTGSPVVPTTRAVLFKTVEMSDDDINRDIDIYISHALKTDRPFSRLGADLQKEIHDAVLSRCEGMFRYAHCQMCQLKQKATGRQLRRALLAMPSDLNEGYARILRELRHDVCFFKESLRWLCYSQRPLKLNELADLVVIEDGDTGINDDIRLLDPMATLVEQSNGLVTYDVKTDIVSLGHSTVKTFLTSDAILERHGVSDFAIGTEEVNHHRFLRTCMRYLSFAEFERGYGSINSATFKRHPAINYISSSWPHYLKVDALDDWGLVSDFFGTRCSSNAGIYGSWIHILATNLPPDIVSSTHPIYYAAAFGYTSLVKAILVHEQDIDLEAPGGRRGSTVLQMSCFRLRKEIVHLLVEAGADPFSPDGSPSGRSSVWWAQQNDWDDLVGLMNLRRGRRSADHRDLDARRTHDEATVGSVQNSRSENNADKFFYISSQLFRVQAVQEYVEKHFAPEEYEISRSADGRYCITTSRPITEKNVLNALRKRDFDQHMD